jgi:hypothetical protein
VRVAARVTAPSSPRGCAAPICAKYTTERTPEAKPHIHSLRRHNAWSTPASCHESEPAISARAASSEAGPKMPMAIPGST